MDKIRIIINSCPRSGHAWLQTVLMDSLGRRPEINFDDIHDNFITRANTPAMLLGKFDNAIQTTILRDPATIIPSIVTKTMGYRAAEISEDMPKEERKQLERMKELYALPRPKEEIEAKDRLAEILMGDGDLAEYFAEMEGNDDEG